MLARGYYKSEGTQTDVVTPRIEITEKTKMASNVKKASDNLKQNVRKLKFKTIGRIAERLLKKRIRPKIQEHFICGPTDESAQNMDGRVLASGVCFAGAGRY
ncbi:hypothetical protein HHI36_008095 [Cryptolaemus montrouzieri]|uniref:Uncharacterized protein n=1 Tax=Cryptolaemus montrouzieri TaxID=559131 RepID=A0ABD2MRC6_9CUCU